MVGFFTIYIWCFIYWFYFPVYHFHYGNGVKGLRHSQNMIFLYSIIVGHLERYRVFCGSNEQIIFLLCYITLTANKAKIQIVARVFFTLKYYCEHLNDPYYASCSYFRQPQGKWTIIKLLSVSQHRSWLRNF